MRRWHRGKAVSGHWPCVEASNWLGMGSYCALLWYIKLRHGGWVALMVRLEQELPLGAVTLYICCDSCFEMVACCLAGRRALRLRRMPLVPPAFPPPGSVFGGLCVCIMHPPLAIVAMATAVAALADGVTAIGAAVAPAATVTAVPGVAAVVAAAFASQLRAVPRLPLPRPTLPHLPRPPQPLPSPPLGSPPPLPALLVEFCRSC